jgi:2-oxoglutarate dehydrogenase E2 component (dihydrolipoamide succinyltransferase)
MSPIRRKIAERLLAARQQTAMLTTFNEVDMSRIVALRQKYREHYQQRFGSKPGLMPFFVKACCEALREFPAVNAAIDGSDIVYHDYYDIGIAIGGEKGLVVPVLRDADRLRFREIDAQIEAYTAKVTENRLAIADLEGGTFTISNGGVYGSLLSTPIINPPQSAVLGMHAIQERPVVRDGQIVIRPMMYLALSYDHRLIDGRVAVQFLKRVKELVEEPEELLLEG